MSTLYYFARGKDPMYTLETSEAERVKDLLAFYGLRKWGFVIYRCTYGDDGAWDRFMGHMDERKDAILSEYYGMPELAKSLDWNVQSDSSSLDGASKDHVRRRFREWVASPEARSELPQGIDDYQRGCLLEENPRYNYCIHVDSASLQSVLNGPPPMEADTNNTSYVNLIRADESWQYPDFDRFDWSKRALDSTEEEDQLDENEPEIEGCRMYDVGWMKASVYGLVPSVYETLTSNSAWHWMYCRPPNNFMKR